MNLEKKKQKKIFNIGIKKDTLKKDIGTLKKNEMIKGKMIKQTN